MAKKLLFVINTMGRGGAEAALLELLRVLSERDLELNVRIMLSQGELAERLPEGVRLLNEDYDPADVLSREGKRRLTRHLLGLLPRRGALLRDLPYLLVNGLDMLRRGALQPDKLLWRVVADATPPDTEEYDLAVSYIEGASAHYVANRVRAKRKAAFIHVDYRQAGYTRMLDGRIYEAFDRIFCVSEDVLASFESLYPEHAQKLDLFYNLIDRERVLRLAAEPGGFDDGYEGVRILTVGRLVAQKALEISVEAMRLLRDAGVKARWYVLGEGNARSFLEGRIAAAGLQYDFVLLGVRDNPYPFFRQADLYVHCSRFEGRSIALQEALMLGCPAIVSDRGGNRGQVTDGVDGLMVPLEPTAIAAAIRRLLDDPALRRSLGERAAAKKDSGRDLEKLLALLEEE